MNNRPPRVLILNGIESAGVNSVDRVGYALEPLGYQIEDVALRPTKWYQGRENEIWLENLNRIHAVAQPGDHVVAHSNGCRLCFDMLDGGFRFGNLFWFAPALDKGLTLRDCCYRHCDVFANPHDKALLAGQFLWRHRWGAMGRVGYKGPCVGKVRTLFYPNRQGMGHGHYFEGELLKQLVRVIDMELRMGARSYAVGDRTPNSQLLTSSPEATNE